MQIDTHKHFDKMWAKLSAKHRKQVLVALRLFEQDKNNPKLRLHQLKGKYYPQYSISAGGDLRIHYVVIDNNRVVLTLVGTHSQLYS